MSVSTIAAGVYSNRAARRASRAVFGRRPDLAHDDEARILCVCELEQRHVEAHARRAAGGNDGRFDALARMLGGARFGRVGGERLLDQIEQRIRAEQGERRLVRPQDVAPRRVPQPRPVRGAVS